MASPAFRSTSNATGVASGQTVTEPAGAATDDIFIAVAYIESSGASFSPPSGWSGTFTAGSSAVDSGVMTTPSTWEAHAYWIRRGGSAPALTFNFGTSAYCEVRVTAYSGAYNSGDPFSFVNVATRNTASANTPYPDTSGTTDTADELLVWNGAQFVGGSAAFPTGWTARGSIGSDVQVADLAQASAGSTGAVTGANAGTGTDNAASFLFGLRSLAAPGGSTVPLHVLQPGVPYTPYFRGWR